MSESEQLPARPGRSPFTLAAEALIATASVAGLVVFAAVAYFRMRFPFELEWIEGSMLDHVRRVIAGLPLYPPPSLDFIPALYPPLYYYVAALACRAFGDGLFALRVVSSIAALGCFVLIFEVVRREQRRALWALFAAGLFAATYRACGAWLDLARVDSLFLFFLLASIACVRFGDSAAAGVAAGLLAAAATLTKQTALPALAPLVCWTVFYRRRRAVPLLASFGAAFAVAAFLLDRASAGWFWRYCFTYQAQQPMSGHSPWAFWTVFIFGQTPIAAMAAVAYLAGGWFGRRNAETWFYAALLAGTGGISWLAYTKSGGADNNFLPLAAVLAIVAALGFAEAVRMFAGRPRAQRLAIAAIAALCLAQFASLRYDPAALVPSPADAAAGGRLLATLRVFPGEVFIAGHGYLGPSIGKRSHSHAQGWQDVFHTRDSAAKRALEAEITAAFAGGRFDAIVLDDLDYPFLRILLTRYRYVGELFRNDEFWPKSGIVTRPDFLFVRNDPAVSEDDATGSGRHG